MKVCFMDPCVLAYGRNNMLIEYSLFEIFMQANFKFKPIPGMGYFILCLGTKRQLGLMKNVYIFAYNY